MAEKMPDYTYSPRRILHAFDKFSGQLLGVVVEIKNDIVTYRGLGTRTLYSSPSCWFMVWEG